MFLIKGIQAKKSVLHPARFSTPAIQFNFFLGPPCDPPIFENRINTYALLLYSLLSRSSIHFWRNNNNKKIHNNNIQDHVEHSNRSRDSLVLPYHTDEPVFVVVNFGWIVITYWAGGAAAANETEMKSKTLTMNKHLLSDCVNWPLIMSDAAVPSVSFKKN